MNRDQVFRDPHNQIVDFAFDANVVRVFPDMIRRSVPGYEVVVPMSGLLVARELQKCTSRRIYDLGCSLGATTLAVLRALDGVTGAGEDSAGAANDAAHGSEHGTAHGSANIVAVDNSAPMIEQARSLVTDPRVSFVTADVIELEFEPCAGVLLNYLLQFISPELRLQLLSRIRAQLDPRGLLVVSEKIRFADPADQAYHDAAHRDFKLANGYSELEVSQKRNALEKVMIVDTEEQHLERFAAAGFSFAQKWFQCLNWASFLVRV